MKRSTQVALLLMGVAGIGASAYAFTSAKRDCVAPGAPAASPVGKDGKLEPCPPRQTYSSSSGYYRSTWRSSQSSSGLTHTVVLACRSGQRASKITRSGCIRHW